MKKIIVALTVLGGLIILEVLAPFVLWPLPLVLFVFLKTRDHIKVYGTAFLLGVLADLVVGQMIGVSAVILVLFGLGLFALEAKFKANLKFSLVLTLLCQVIYLFLYLNV